MRPYSREARGSASFGTGNNVPDSGDKETRMPVGRAKAATPETAGEEFRLVVPCFTRVDETRIRDHLRRDQFFWLDLNGPGPDELAQLREIFGFHPLALEDTEHFGQRPKLDNYDDYIFLVFFGAWRHGGKDAELLHEVHLFITGHAATMLAEIGPIRPGPPPRSPTACPGDGPHTVGPPALHG